MGVSQERIQSAFFVLIDPPKVERWAYQVRAEEADGEAMLAFSPTRLSFLTSSPPIYRIFLDLSLVFKMAREKQQPVLLPDPAVAPKVDRISPPSSASTKTRSRALLALFLCLASYSLLDLVTTARTEGQATWIDLASRDPAQPDWQPCKNFEDQPRFQCATQEVPLDYAQGFEGGTATIALSKYVALPDRKKLGTVFVNPCVSSLSFDAVHLIWAELEVELTPSRRLSVEGLEDLARLTRSELLLPSRSYSRKGTISWGSIPEELYVALLAGSTVWPCSDPVFACAEPDSPSHGLLREARGRTGIPQVTLARPRFAGRRLASVRSGRPNERPREPTRRGEV